jgi:hypothetical protein
VFEHTDFTAIDLVIGQLGCNFFQALLAAINIGVCFDLRPVDWRLIFFKIIRISRGGFYFFNDGSVRFGINAVDAAADNEAKPIRFNLVGNRNFGLIGIGT